jgi:hypothetical protein
LHGEVAKLAAGDGTRRGVPLSIWWKAASLAVLDNLTHAIP